MFIKGATTKHFLLLALLVVYVTQASSNSLTCYSQPNGAVLPVVSDCHVYIYCLDQTPFTIPCPFGMGFSTNKSRCLPLSQSDCETDLVTPTAVHVQGRGICDNEKSEANKQACKGQTFGEMVPYPGDCSKFLVCNCEYPTVKQCQGGTWFDNKIKTCNYPQNVDCDDGNGGNGGINTTGATTLTPTIYPTTTPADRTTTTESSQEWGKDCEAPAGMSEDICLNYNNGFLLRYPYNCNAYINCTLGCPVMNYCPPDKVFNAFLKICDTPDTAQCIELPMPSTTTLTTEEMSSSTTEETTTSSTAEKSTSTPEETTIELTTTSTSIPEECVPPLAVDADICSSQTWSIYQPYPYNCSAYIICQDLEPCLKYCEEGKIFNSLLGICDEDIQCEEIPLPSTTNKPETTTSSSTTELPIITTTVLPPDVNPNLCRGKEDYMIYPYEADCSQYLICLGGEVKVENCPKGWLFNAKLMVCDKASEEVCYTGLTTTTEGPTTTSAVSTTQEPTFDLCIDQPSGKTFPYKENCELYYYCRGNGQYFIISCPASNYYDSYSGNCGPNVSPTACKEPLTTTAAPTTPATTLSPSQKCANQSNGVTYPYEENCAQYIYCMGSGDYVIMNCPYNNYYYPDLGNCGPSDDINICRKPSGISSTSAITTTSTEETTTEIAITSTPPPILGVCGSFSNGQLIPYPYNCQKYISCVKPIPIGFYCNNGWYFNDLLQKCVPDVEGSCLSGLPSNETTTAATPQDICQGLKEGDFQIYPSNCQFYYECLGDGYYMLKTCTEGEYFDPLFGQCSSKVGPDYCQQNFNTTLPPPTTTPKPKPQGICVEQTQGEKIPYPHNCTKYIVCENPIPIGINCDQGLEFSSKAQKCVESSESDCGLLTTIPTTTITVPPPTKPYNQCTNKPDFTLLPYEQNCGMFIICLQDIEHWAYCPAGEYFDLDESQCIKTNNEDACRISSTATTTETTTTTTQDPNLGPCYNKTEGTKIPYPNNCTKYIVCQDPLNVGYDCPAGLEFSVYYDECVIPELADCSIKTTSTTSTTAEQTTPPLMPDTCENKPTGSTLPYTEDCSKYYMCINGKEMLTNCMPNSFFDPSTGDCDPKVSSTACQGANTTPKPTPVPSQGPCNDEENGFIFANKENCNQYYMCLNDTSVLCQCQNETYYNPYTKECDPETTSNDCKEPVTTVQPTISTLTTETSNNSTITTPTEPTNKSTTVEPPTPPELTKDNICCGKKSGTYLPYPNDNSKYVICLYPLPEVHTCAPGSTYDTESLSCKLVTQF